MRDWTTYLLLVLISPLALAALDGRVAGLKQSTFDTLRELRRTNPGAFTQADARRLAGTIQEDGQFDDAERDLLEELTQSHFRKILVTCADSSSEGVSMYPTSGEAKRILQLTLKPPAKLDEAWEEGQEGWTRILTAYRTSPDEEARVLSYVQEKLNQAWAESNPDNGYKPFRDSLTLHYGYSSKPGSDLITGRSILYKAARSLDTQKADKIPDFLYNWVRPGGYL